MKNQNQNIVLRSRDGNVMQHTHQGSLGLLALGDVGLHIWRKLKEEHAAEKLVGNSNSPQSNTHFDPKPKT